MLRHRLIAALVVGHTAMAGECPTTLPLAPGFTPPAPYRQRPSVGTFWYGTKDLWTQLADTGRWRGLNNDGNLRTKLIFWRQGYDWRKVQHPPLVVTAHRIDGDALAATVSQPNSIFVTHGPSAMMVGMGLPSAGCWQITAVYEGTALDFIVAVQP